MYHCKFVQWAFHCSIILLFPFSGFAGMMQKTGVDTASSTATAVIRTDSATLHELDTLKVSVSRSLHPTSSITTVRSEQFLGKCTDLPAVLEQVSGVAVRRTGGFGEYSDASIRGSSPKQVQVYLDGIPLNSAAGGAVDLSKIPLTTLRDVTVYKGSVPLDLMGTSAGAVINLRSGAKKDMASGLLELGSFGYRKTGSVIRKKIGPMTHYFSVDYSGARNNYPYEDDNATPYNSNDDVIKLKNHNASKLIGINYSADWLIRDNHRLNALVTCTDKFKEVFHPQFVDVPQFASHSSESILGRLAWEYTPSENSTVETRFEGRYKRTLFDDPLGHVYLSGARKDRNTFPFTALRCRISRKVNDYLSAQLLMRGGFEGYTSENLLASSSGSPLPTALRSTGGAAGECTLHRDNFGINLRYNHVYVRDSANFTPNHGSGKPLPRVWTNHFPNGNIDGFLNMRDWCTFDAAFRYEYFPVSLSDLYGWGENYLGNSDLFPERRFEGSFGGTLRHSLIESSMALFYGTTIDIIELQSHSQRVLRAVNNGDTRQVGVEWDIHATPWKSLTIDNHFTLIVKKRLQLSSNDWNEQLLLFFSPIENDFRITMAHRYFSLGHSIHYRSPFYSNYTKATDLVSPAPACNVSVSITPISQVTLTYRCENYLNVAYMPMNYYTPLPGRMHFCIGTIQW